MRQTLRLAVLIFEFRANLSKLLIREGNNGWIFLLGQKCEWISLPERLDDRHHCILVE